MVNGTIPITPIVSQVNQTANKSTHCSNLDRHRSSDPIGTDMDCPPADMQFRADDGGVTVVFGRGCVAASLATEVARLVPSCSGALVVSEFLNADQCRASRFACTSTNM